MQEVIHQGERLHEFPYAVRFEDHQVWDDETGPPTRSEEMDPSIESLGPVRSDPSWGQGDPETEEEVEESSEEDEPASCSERARGPCQDGDQETPIKGKAN